jgi:signal transduction histidine kinase
MTRNSLRRFIILAVAVACTILVVCYSLLLRFYLTRGLHMDTEYRLDAEASLYLEQYAENPETPLPRTATITSFLGYDALPADVRAVWPREALTPGAFMQTLSKNHLFYLHGVRRADGRDVFFLFDFQVDQQPSDATRQFFTYYLYLPVAIGVVTISLIILLAVSLLRRIARPVENLRNWAMGLEMDNLEDEPPPLTYIELNQLAELFRSNLRRLNDGVTREKQFQQYASHELRTPIAILANNLELMDRLGIHEHACFESSFARMEKAVKRMLHLTNTLLWVCREEKTRLPEEEIKLDSLISTVIDENSYLLIGKDIALDIRMESRVIRAPKAVVHIVLSNVLRNAFQHTTHGRIAVRLEQDGRLEIVNDTHADSGGGSDGFGLGLQLTKQLADHLGFRLEIVDSVDQYAVVVTPPTRP